MKVTKEFCQEFNKCRAENIGKILTKEEIMDMLVQRVPNFKRHHMLFANLVKGNVILRIKRKNYLFSPNPVYIGVLSRIVEDTNAYFRERMQVYYNSVSKEEKEAKEKELEYIAFLKRRGYTIYK